MTESKTKTLVYLVLSLPVYLAKYVGGLLAWCIAMLLCVGVFWLAVLAFGYLAGHRGV